MAGTIAKPLPIGAEITSDDFAIMSQAPLVRFVTRGVQPPSYLYTDTSDGLTVACASSAAGEMVTVSYRFLRADGQLIKGQFIVQPPSDRSIKAYTEPLAEGFLLSVSCKAAIATTRGQTFARVFLSDPALGKGFPSYMLMADYVTTAMAPAHPNGRQLAPSEGPGRVYAVQCNTFGPGAEWAIVVPANARWKLSAFGAQFAIAAGGANRVPKLSVASGGTQTYLGGAEASGAPGTAVFVAGGGPAPSVTAAALLLPLPIPTSLTILAGFTIQSVTDNLAAGDNWVNPFLSVEEWLDNV